MYTFINTEVRKLAGIESSAVNIGKGILPYIYVICGLVIVYIIFVISNLKFKGDSAKLTRGICFWAAIAIILVCYSIQRWAYMLASGSPGFYDPRLMLILIPLHIVLWIILRKTALKTIDE